jgi:hypothetical protein
MKMTNFLRQSFKGSAAIGLLSGGINLLVPVLVSFR